MLRRNNSGKIQVLQNRQHSDIIKIGIDGVADDAAYDVPAEWPGVTVFDPTEFSDPKIYAVVNTFGNPPHLKAAIYSVMDHVDGFVVLHGCSWSGREEPNTIPDILAGIEWGDKEVFVEDVAGKYRGKSGQLEQRTYAFRFLREGDWYWILDDDEVWDDLNAKQFANTLRNTREIAVSVSLRAYWQSPSIVGWTETVCRAVRKLRGSKFVGVSQCADANGALYPQLKAHDIFYHHYSYVNSDRAIQEKIDDYARRNHVGEFAGLRSDFMQQLFDCRLNGYKVGLNVHPILGYTKSGLQHADTPSPAAFTRYSKFGAVKISTLSVVVVTYNSAHCLLDMLKSFIQYRPGCGIEIIIVDNNSNSFEYVQQAVDFLTDFNIAVKTIRNTSNLMFTRAVNQGLAESTGYWKLLVNPDVKFIQDGWFEGLLSVATKLHADIIAPKMIYEDGRLHYGGGTKRDGKYYHVAREDADQGQCDAAGETEWATGACFLFSNALYLALGGLDEKYKHYESDNKYCELAWQSGFRVAYAGKQSTIIHYCGHSSS